MTPDEQIEWRYRYDERLGILCEDREPTAEEEAEAKACANLWLFKSRDAAINGNIAIDKPI